MAKVFSCVRQDFEVLLFFNSLLDDGSLIPGSVETSGPITPVPTGIFQMNVGSFQDLIVPGEAPPLRVLYHSPTMH